MDVPQFSTLNADVIPTPPFLEALDSHQPKFDPDLIKEIWKSIGLQTSDDRLYKLASSMLEIQLLKIITEIKSVAPQQPNHRKEMVPKTQIQFDDLAKAMEEFGIALRRPAYLEEPAAQPQTGLPSSNKAREQN